MFLFKCVYLENCEWLLGHLFATWPIRVESLDSYSVMVRASASEAGGRGFDPGPGHTKDFKNGTSGYLAWRSAL